MTKKKEKEIPVWVWILIGILLMFIGFAFLISLDEPNSNSGNNLQSISELEEEVYPGVVSICQSKKTLCEEQVRFYNIEGRNCGEEYHYCLLK